MLKINYNIIISNLRGLGFWGFWGFGVEEGGGGARGCFPDEQT
jgi:hypothetical protein